jgi:dTDP-4-amino-4,6-dideoxygalactose transaminase
VIKTVIPFSPPYIDDLVINEVVDSLKSGWITTGPKVKALETEIASYTGIKNVLCVNSWTSGAFLILKWLGIKEGDEVIIPAYTYSATALVVLNCGARPVMVDVGDDFVISTQKIKAAITPRTKAIIPVDIAGWPCDYTKIYEIINGQEIKSIYNASSDIQRKLGRILILADAAHSFGAVLKNNSAITKCDIGVFSLHAVKNLTTAEGGVVCLNLPESFDNFEVYKYLRMMALNGQTKDAFSKSKAGSWRYDIIMQGLKINMPDVCAAIGLAQIRQYDYILSERKRVFQLYSDLLSKFHWAQLPPQDDDIQTSSYHLYALRIKGINEKQRDSMIDCISATGIAVNVHFIPLPMLTLFKNEGYDIIDYPISYDNYSREISLPIYPQLTNDNVRYIIDNIDSAYRQIVCSKQ